MEFGGLDNDHCLEEISGLVFAFFFFSFSCAFLGCDDQFICLLLHAILGQFKQNTVYPLLFPRRIFTVQFLKQTTFQCVLVILHDLYLSGTSEGNFINLHVFSDWHSCCRSVAWNHIYNTWRETSLSRNQQKRFVFLLSWTRTNFWRNKLSFQPPPPPPLTFIMHILHIVVNRLKSYLVGHHFLHSHYLTVFFRGDNVRGISMLVPPTS